MTENTKGANELPQRAREGRGSCYVALKKGLSNTHVFGCVNRSVAQHIRSAARSYDRVSCIAFVRGGMWPSVRLAVPVEPQGT